MSDDRSGILCASGGKLPSRQEQAVLAKAVGARMREARELAGMSQIYAAKQLGYSNSSKLAKIEGGKDSSQIPMWVIKRSARLYDASIDCDGQPPPSEPCLQRAPPCGPSSNSTPKRPWRG